MWNALSRSSLPGPHVQCARGWGRPWVAFMWDDAFAALQLGALGARSLAYSNLITLLKGLSEGFVPNMWMPNWISFDRSGPPVVSTVLRYLYAKFGDSWLVELLWDDAYTWLDWFWRRRRLAPLGLIALGSDPGALASRFNSPSLRMAKLESGMDNSPMYDNATFDDGGAAPGPSSASSAPASAAPASAAPASAPSRRATRLMQLYDVGMSSLVAAEMRHLAALGREALPASRLGGTACDLLESRAAELSAAVQAHLWNDELGAFTNRHANGSMSARVSPTSFYPLLASIATDRQAHRLAVEWLTSSRRFCVDAGTQPPGTQPEEQQARSDEYFWGLPSISYDDPSYREQDYWRGLVRRAMPSSCIPAYATMTTSPACARRRGRWRRADAWYAPGRSGGRALTCARITASSAPCCQLHRRPFPPVGCTRGC